MGFGGEEEGNIKDGGDVVSCSICLEVVTLEGDRSTARLQCGHHFHLDCIGSAFNAKGLMQCPNCRKIEKGSWLYANGARPLQDVSMGEWTNDEDPYDVSYSEMPFRLHWCPFGRLIQLPSLFEERESPSPVTAHDFIREYELFAEQLAAISAASHPCPYVAYLHPLQPSSSSSNSHMTQRTMDATAYHDQWSQLAGDGRPLLAVHPVDYHQNHWVRMSHSYAQTNNNNNIVADQSTVPLGAIRTAMPDNDGQQRGSLFNPSFYSNGYSSRSRNRNVPPLIPQFMSPHGNISEHYQQNSSSVFAGTQRPGGLRPVTSGGPPPQPTQVKSTAFCLFPSGSSGPSSLESEDPGGKQFYAWERDRFAPYPLVPVECETSWWGSSQQSHSSSDMAAPRRLFGQWIGVDRSPLPLQSGSESSSYRQMHVP